MGIDIFEHNHTKDTHYGSKDVVVGEVFCRFGICKTQYTFEIGDEKSAGAGLGTHVEKHGKDTEKEMAV